MLTSERQSSARAVSILNPQVYAIHPGLTSISSLCCGQALCLLDDIHFDGDELETQHSFDFYFHDG